MLKGKITLNKGDIINLRRPKTEKDNVPPVIITLSDESKRLQILKLRNLKLEQESGEPIMVYCAPDRTIIQRNLYRDLRKTLRERKEKGESDLVIRNYKIVKLQSCRFNLDDHWKDLD